MPTQNYLDARIKMHEEQILKLMQEQKRAERWAFLDELTDEDVLFFKYAFTTGCYYTYCFLRCNGLWYGTGPRAPKGFTTAELIQWLLNARDVKDVWRATDWERI